MPGFNRKGPLGEGPMTGRGSGFCTPSNTSVEETMQMPNIGDSSFCRGLGRGRRRMAGRGFNRSVGGFRQGRNAPFLMENDREMQPSLKTVADSIDRLVQLAEKVLARSEKSEFQGVKPGASE